MLKQFVGKKLWVMVSLVSAFAYADEISPSASLLDQGVSSVRRWLLSEADLDSGGSGLDKNALLARIQSLNIPDELKEKVIGERVVQISASYASSLYLTDPGEVYFSGRSEFPKKLDLTELNGQKVIQVVAAPQHGLLLTQQGEVYSFGSGQWGKLGHGNSLDYYRPKKIQCSSLQGHKIVQMAAGNSNTLLLTDQGRVFSFGSGGEGRLGLRLNLNQYTPQLIQVKALSDHSLVPFQDKIIQIAVGESHSLLLNDQGQVYSFGSNSYGQLGQKDIIYNLFSPRMIEDDQLKKEKVIQIAVNQSHSLLLTATGRVYSFGNGSFGQLGHNSLAYQMSPKLIEGEDLRGQRVTQISAGYFHSLLLTDEGKVYWFGHGVTHRQLSPKRVEAMVNHRIVQISAGDSYGLLLTDQGQPVGLKEETPYLIGLGWKY